MIETINPKADTHGFSRGYLYEGGIMSKNRILLALFSILILFQGFDAQAQEAKVRMEMQRLDIKEKLAIILPKAMRENDIDMWILVNKYGGSDPINAELGGGGSPGDKYYKH